MAENLIISDSISKEEKYQTLLPQLKGLVSYEENLIANLANIASALKTTFDFFWVGFYLKDNNNLVLGPFQGPIACTRIAFDKGVCGACYTQKKSLLVDDVEKFPGHIACSSASKSELVVPIIKDSEVKIVIDIDSDKLADFDEVDKLYIEQVAEVIAQKL